MITIAITLVLVAVVSAAGIRASKWGAVFWGMNILYSIGLAALGLSSGSALLRGFLATSEVSFQSALWSTLVYSVFLCGAQWAIRPLLNVRRDVRPPRRNVVLAPLAFFVLVAASVYLGRNVSYADYVAGNASGWWSAFFLTACCMASIERGRMRKWLVLAVLIPAGLYLVAVTGTRFLLIAVGAAVLGNFVLNGVAIRLTKQQWGWGSAVLLIFVLLYQYFDFQRVGVVRLPEQNVIELAAIVSQIPANTVGWEVSNYFSRFIAGFVSLPASKLGIYLSPVDGEVGQYIARDFLRFSAGYAHFPATWWVDLRFQPIQSQLVSLMFIALINQAWPALLARVSSVAAFFPLLAVTQMLIARGAVAHTGALVLIPVALVVAIVTVDSAMQRAARVA